MNGSPDDTPTISGPQTYDRAAVDPPAFRVSGAQGRFYAVEVGTDASLFEASREALRTPANFYASWSAGSLLPVGGGATIYQLPAQAWRSLRMADRLYYRVLTSAAADGWTDVRASLRVQDWAQAPWVELRGRFENVEPRRVRPEELHWRTEPPADVG
jgi:hypothetical protein